MRRKYRKTIQINFKVGIIGTSLLMMLGAVLLFALNRKETNDYTTRMWADKVGESCVADVRDLLKNMKQTAFVLVQKYSANKNIAANFQHSERTYWRNVFREIPHILSVSKFYTTASDSAIESSDNQHNILLERIKDDVLETGDDKKLSAGKDRRRIVPVFDPGELKRVTFGINVPVLAESVEVGVLHVEYSGDTLLSVLQNFKKETEKFLLLDPRNYIIFSSEDESASGKDIIAYKGPGKSLYEEYTRNDVKAKQANTKIYTKTIHNGRNNDWLLIYKVNKYGNNSYYYWLFASAAIFFFGLLLQMYFIRREKKYNLLINNLLERLSLGKTITIPPQKNQSKENDTSSLEQINKLSQELDNLWNFNENVINGNFEKRLIPRSEDDKLFASANLMAENLLKEQKNQHLNAAKIRRQMWIQRGIFELSETERKTSGDMKQLSFNLIRTIVNYTDALLGAIYIVDNESNRIEINATYAYGNEKNIQAEFAFGEGPVGTCVEEKQILEYYRLPKDYIKVTSGLGEALPGYLLLIPIIFQNTTRGVIEIAFTRKPKSHVIEFIKQLSRHIGSWINASQKSMQVTSLLKEEEKKPNTEK